MSIKEKIIKSIEPLIISPEFITINEPVIPKIAENINLHTTSSWDSEYIFKDGTAKSVNYLGLFSALSFAYWGNPKWQLIIDGQELGGSYSLFYALKRAIENGIDISDAKVMQSLPFSTFAKILESTYVIPYVKERYEIMQEIGSVLMQRFNGNFTYLFEEAEYNANKVNELLVDNFICFNDAHNHEGNTIYFYKKSQEVITLIYEQFHGIGLGAFTHMEDLTASSDYKLPQILNAFGILKYHDVLKDKIISKTILEGNSREALEIRAGTIYACEKIVEYFTQRGKQIRSFEISNVLWTLTQTDTYHTLPHPKIAGIWV